MTSDNEYPIYVEDDGTDLTPAQKNQNLAIFLQGTGINLDIIKITRKEGSLPTGWKITYRTPGRTQ